VQSRRNRPTNPGGLVNPTNRNHGGKTMTRDETITEEIAQVEADAGGLVNQLGALVRHAEDHHALAHAALYEQVQGCLSAATKQLHRAADIMRNGDPADYETTEEPV
jgi:hypothetical protein